jgi:hypothetical protein
VHVYADSLAELAGKSYSDQLRVIIKSLGDQVGPRLCRVWKVIGSERRWIRMSRALSFHEQGILVMLDMHRLRDDEESLNNDADELIGSLVSTPVI